MKKLAACFLLLVNSAFGAELWSMGYYTPWGSPPMPISGIQFSGLTHVVHGWALVNSDGSLDLDLEKIRTDAPALVAAAHAAGKKAVLGVGQRYWDGQTTNLQSAVTNVRSTLVNNIMNVVNTYGYDGVDIDWEPFSGGGNGPAMTALATDLRSRLGTKSLTTSVILTEYSYWGSAHGPFDRINMMTYDMAGTWDPYSWHNAALYDPDGMVWSVDLAVRRFSGAGVPFAKLGIGIPFYGWQWRGGGVSGPRQPFSSPSMSQVQYNAFFSQITPQNLFWDSVGQVPYLSNNAGTPSFLSFDNEQSITAKVSYAKSKGLGGWVIWAIDQDYFPNQAVKHPLLDAVSNAMGSISPSPSPAPTPSPSPSPSPSPISGSPVALMHLNEAAGSTSFYNASGNGSNASCVSGASCPTSGVTGRSGTAIQLDGVSKYVTIAGSAALRPTSTVAVAAFIKKTTYPNATAALPGEEIVSMGDSYALDIRPDGNVLFFIYDGTDWRTVLTAGVNVVNGQFHHVVGQKTASALEVYVDGVLKASTPYTGTISYTLGPDLMIGKHGVDAARYFNGVIDEVYVYGRSLSSSEIHSLASVNNPAPDPSPSPTPSPSPSPSPSPKPTVDTTPPSIRIISPANGTRISRWSVPVTVSATDNVGVSYVQLFVDGVLSATSTTAPFTTNWNTKRYLSGAHTLQVKAFDAAGNSGVSAIVTVYR